MEIPKIKNTIEDKEAEVVYHVMAYRKLTHAEKIAAIRHYLSTKKGKNPKRGSIIEIRSLLVTFLRW